jgi:hypothetical protein
MNMTACAYCDYLECRCEWLDDTREETTEEDQ